MPLECISTYLKPVLRYKFVILDTYHPDVSKAVRIRGYFAKPKGVSKQNSFVNFTTPSVLIWDYLLTSIWFSVSVWSFKWISLKINWQRIYFTPTHSRNQLQNRTVATQSAANFMHNGILYCFKPRHFVAACRDGFDTPVFGNNPKLFSWSCL
jgi:hypothetical protein